ncbi:MAG: peptidyl-prolyl cis-trans isomerase [Saccharospirillaceae bacterium]|nr:peptidyl-prolyl cis-trans isomerase [Saccharospirillaceae bacterium]MCD8530469.1 peptidyl-prolyl cis-trans isomerase [Saccharospirillaceae bacterium]
MKTHAVFFAVILSFFVPATASAGIQYSLEHEKQIARVGDLTLSRTLLDIFLHKQQKAAQASGKTLTLQTILQQLLDDALMAEYARRHLSAEQLNPENRVAFASRVERHNRLVSLLRDYFNEPIVASVNALPGKNFSSLVQWNPELTTARLNALIKLQPGLTIDLTPEQKSAAAGFVVLNTALAESGSVSLLDIYQRQNVQGRLALQSGNLDYLHQQTRLYVGGLYVLNWAQKQLSAEDWQALQQVILNQEHRLRLMESMGIHMDIHDDNPALRARAARITDAELRAGYDQHKDDFRVVERAKVRHIRVADQQQADAIVAEIRGGLSFADAVTRYSIAADKHNGGELGWLKRSDTNRTWLHSVAFVQPENQVSPAFRSPQNEGEVVYEILWVDERVDGYLPLSDEGVRYELSHQLAREALQQDLQALQKQLRTDADIQLNRRLRPQS